MSLEEWLAIGVPDEIADQAMTWIARLDSEDCDRAVQEAFQQWLSADPVHLWAFEELSEFWAKTSFLDVPQDLSILVQQDSLGQPIRPELLEYSRYPKIATTAIFCIAIGLLASLL